MGHKILVIDDSFGVRTHVEQHLVQKGHEVQVAENIFEFDQFWGSFRPDAVISDVEMPDVSGPDLLRDLIEKHRQDPVAFILMSALPEEKLAEAARSCGAHAWANKVKGLDYLHAVVVTTIQRVQKGRPTSPTEE